MLQTPQPQPGLIYLPHVVTVGVATEAVDPNTLAVSAPSYGTPATVKCQMTPLSAEAVYQETGLSLNNPWLLMGNTPDATKFTVGNDVFWTNPVDGVSRHLRIASPAEAFGTGQNTDHFSVHLEELELS